MPQNADCAGNIDGQTNGQKMDKRTVHQFRKEPSYDGDVCLSSLNLIGQSVFELES